ncbi:DoxX-like family protein [Iamia majanohamensis]|uniref:DoxX-like family protein n=1 Tax=Iamia majanohamensis TaxID=467976 RepID=A0AAE9Y476_9ACTN|nr:DoxX-like family protein [Iamia majanohamensis]WCO65914.1 DoxX-like family protein [Iamia majanohamensis]
MASAPTDVRSEAEAGEQGTPDRVARGMAVGLVAIGVLHFVSPGVFERIVPRVLGHAKELVYLSGVVEIASGVLIAVPRTRRTGALLAAATMVAVYPANWQMALDAGWPPRGAEGWGAWIRLPFQVPMVWLALRVARRAQA